jgi:hypothetical protein
MFKFSKIYLQITTGRTRIALKYGKLQTLDIHIMVCK